MQTLFGRSLALFGASTALALGLPLALSGAVKTGAMAGVVTAALASALALGLLKLTWNSAVKQVLAALVVGFLIRMMMVAAGLLVAKAIGGELLAFAAGFFGLFLVHQMIEIGVVARRARERAMESKA